MKLTSISCGRYRAFKDQVFLELKPITIIIGKNGSGKSVLSRLPLLIFDAIQADAEGVINLTAGNVEHGTSFEDLINERSALPFSLGIKISNESECYTSNTKIRHVAETKSLVIESFEIKKNNESILVMELSTEEDLISSEQKYKISGDSFSDFQQTVVFSGILPKLDKLPNEIINILNPIFSAMRRAYSEPSYLGPFREEPERVMRIPNQNIKKLGSRGENTLSILADDKLRRKGGLSEKVAAWFNEELGQSVSVDVSEARPRAIVTNNGVSLGIADTGVGFSQSLPIVVQHLAFRESRLNSSILISEQPELHLHPGAHGAIADLIVDSASANHPNNAICIVETHSEQLIMRVRRRIAEKKISPADVVLWSVNHKSNDFDEINILHRINFDSNGDPDSWPEGVFEEAFADLAKMRSALEEKGE